MREVPADRLLEVYSLRLKVNENGFTKWTPPLRASVEGLVTRLRALDPAALVTIDSDEHRTPIARFILTETGEVLAEIDQPSEGPVAR